MPVPAWSESQKIGCGIVVAALAVLYGLPVSAILWKLALGWYR